LEIEKGNQDKANHILLDIVKCEWKLLEKRTQKSYVVLKKSNTTWKTISREEMT
jgi:hypothetical protein